MMETDREFQSQGATMEKALPTGHHQLSLGQGWNLEKKNSPQTAKQERNGEDVPLGYKRLCDVHSHIAK